MHVLLIFIQIIMFPFVFLGLAWLFTVWARAKKPRFIKVGYATLFAIASYIVGGVVLFPLYMIFRPIKIEGITYLTGANLWAFWLLSFFVVTPLVAAGTAYFLYFRKVPVTHYVREALLIGLYQIPWGWFFEIVIYVYWRQTIPSVYDYFFGKNFPWIDFNWLIGIFCPLIAAYLARRIAEIPGKTGRYQCEDHRK